MSTTLHCWVKTGLSTGGCVISTPSSQYPNPMCIHARSNRRWFLYYIYFIFNIFSLIYEICCIHLNGRVMGRNSSFMYHSLIELTSSWILCLWWYITCTAGLQHMLQKRSALQIPREASSAEPMLLTFVAYFFNLTKVQVDTFL